MNNLICNIQYGKTEIAYELLLMDRRTLEIAVHPDKSVVVKAPSKAALEVIEQKVKKRVRWIKRQMNYFDQFEPRTPERKYVGGESHLYLGRKYRLKIEFSDRNKVRLKNGYFMIESNTNQPEQIERLLSDWYRTRGQIYLSMIFDDCWESFKKEGMNKPYLKLIKMKKRWGSLSSKNQLTLNIHLIKAPKECIEYVVIHELCHILHRNHGTAFYQSLERTMPNWIKRKHKLEMTLA